MSRTCPPRPPHCPPRPGVGIIRAVRLVPARIRHGRPVRLLLRALIAAVLSLLVLASGAGAAIRPRRGDRPDHLVCADRAGGSGPAAGPVTEHDASGGGLRLGDGGHQAGPPYAGWGGRPAGHLAVIPGKPSRPGRAHPGRSSSGALHLDGHGPARTPGGRDDGEVTASQARKCAHAH